jgi:hypothetical protein
MSDIWLFLEGAFEFYILLLAAVYFELHKFVSSAEMWPCSDD